MAVKPFAPTGGKRTGRRDSIDSICSKLMTYEPMTSHGQSDPIKEAAQQGNILDNSAIVDLIPPGAVKAGDLVPATVNTPEGTKVGTGYVTDLGKKLSDATDFNLDPINNAISDLTGSASELLDGIPTFAELDAQLNEFKAALQQEILAITGLGNLVESIKSVLPPIRFPTTSPLKTEIIGYGKLLSDIEYELGLLAIDAQGLIGDLKAGKFGDMIDTIKDVAAIASDSAGFITELAKAGISKLDIPGEDIFQDKFGNILVDISNGIGAVGATLGLTSDLATSFDKIKDSISVPISENQTLALSNFAKSIGPENFRNSNVLRALNAGNYSEVPRLMQGWVMAPNEVGGDGVKQPNLEGLQAMNASLFQTPDNTELNTADFGDTVGGEATYAEIAEQIDVQRENFIARQLALQKVAAGG